MRLVEWAFTRKPFKRYEPLTEGVTHDKARQVRVSSSSRVVIKSGSLEFEKRGKEILFEIVRCLTIVVGYNRSSVTFVHYQAVFIYSYTRSGYGTATCNRT